MTTTTKYLQILTYEDGCHSCELQSTLRLFNSCTHRVDVSMYQSCRDPCADVEHCINWRCDHNLLSTYKLTYRDGCHSCDLQSTFH